MTAEDPAAWSRLNVYDIPTTGQDSTEVDYRVPPETWVLTGEGNIYAQPGDHVHGTKSPESISLGVYDPENCPVCITNPPAVDVTDYGQVRQD